MSDERSTVTAHAHARSAHTRTRAVTSSPWSGASRVRSAALLAWALVATLALVACEPPSEATEDDPRRPVTVALATTPAQMGPAVVEVRPLLDGSPVEGAEVRVVGDMAHAGMAPVEATATASDDGVYRSDGFVFSMAGDWVLTVDVTYPDGTSRSSSVPVQVGR